VSLSKFFTRDFYTKDTNLYTILTVLLPIHVFGVLALFNLSPTVLWTLLFGYVFISGYGIAVCYHRYYSHKAFKTSKPIQALMTYFGVLSGQGSPIFWAAVHRGYHHPFADTEKDLHSPVAHGWFTAYIGWILFLVPKKFKIRAVGDMLRDPIVMFFHKHYYKALWITWVVVALVSWELFLGLCLAQMYAFHQENLVDLFCHIKSPIMGISYRNYETKDKSVNVFPFGYFSWGQAWHNNHHGKPADYNFGEKWWEFDPAKVLVSLIKR